MTRRHIILRAFVPAMTATALGASGASAMPAHDVGSPAGGHATRTHHTMLSPDRVDVAGHAATIRGIGAALAKQARA